MRLVPAATKYISAKNRLQIIDFSGMYYKPITIVNDDSGIINKLETSLIDDARVIICDRHMFIVQDTDQVSGQ